jgi:hypothetical protein
MSGSQDSKKSKSRTKSQSSTGFKKIKKELSIPEKKDRLLIDTTPSEVVGMK